MAGYGHSIIEGLTLPGDSPGRLVAGNFIDETMITHHFSHITIILVAIYKERLSVENLSESFGTSKLLIFEVGINSVTGNILWPVPLLLYEGMTIDTKTLHGNDSDRNAELLSWCPI